MPKSKKSKAGSKKTGSKKKARGKKLSATDVKFAAVLARAKPGGVKRRAAARSV